MKTRPCTFDDLDSLTVDTKGKTLFELLEDLGVRIFRTLKEREDYESKRRNEP